MRMPNILKNVYVWSSIATVAFALFTIGIIYLVGFDNPHLFEVMFLLSVFLFFMSVKSNLEKIDLEDELHKRMIEELNIKQKIRRKKLEKKG